MTCDLVTVSKETVLFSRIRGTSRRIRIHMISSIIDLSSNLLDNGQRNHISSNHI